MHKFRQIKIWWSKSHYMMTLSFVDHMHAVLPSYLVQSSQPNITGSDLRTAKNEQQYQTNLYSLEMLVIMTIITFILQNDLCSTRTKSTNPFTYSTPLQIMKNPNVGLVGRQITPEGKIGTMQLVSYVPQCTWRSKINYTIHVENVISKF